MSVLIALIVFVSLALALRIAYVINSHGRCFPARGRPVRTMVVLGSGGHTAELLTLLDSMDRRAYGPRCYVVAETDKMSAAKALAREQAWAARAAAAHAGDAQAAAAGHDVSVAMIPRSREVGQSYLTSVGTTLYSLAFAARLVLQRQPQLVLVNGPGTCIPVCASAFLYRVLGLLDSRIVYVESIARVRKLSLSGRILYTSRTVDLLLVQWPELHARYPRSVCAGRLY